MAARRCLAENGPKQATRKLWNFGATLRPCSQRKQPRWLHPLTVATRHHTVLTIFYDPRNRQREITHVPAVGLFILFFYSMSSALVLGKRKRRATTAAQVEPARAAPDAAALEDAQAIFRRHFEAQFAPIQDAAPQSKPPPAKAADDDDDDHNTDGVEDMRSDDSESDGDDAWGGLSEEGDRQGACVFLFCGAAR